MKGQYWMSGIGVGVAASVLMMQLSGATQPTQAKIEGEPGRLASLQAGTWGTGQVLLFDRTTDPLNLPRFIVYDAANSHVESSSPHVLDSRNFPNWPDWYKFDAAIRVGNTAYVFRNSNYLAYDLDTKTLLFGPRAITAGWSGWPNGWNAIDDAVYLDNNRTFFFRGNQFIEYSFGSNQVTRAPSAIAATFGNWPASWDSIDAVVRSLNDSDKLFFFRGSQYLRYSLSADKVDLGPQNTEGAWPGWSPSWLSHGVSPDAALPWSSNEYMFFKGESVLPFNASTNTGPVATMALSSVMPNLPWGWRNVDATLNFGNNKFYAFNQGYVLAMHAGTKKIEDGYPREFGSDFPGLPAWGSIEAAFYAGNNKVYFFNGGQTVRYDVVAKTVDTGYPMSITTAFSGLPSTWSAINLAVHVGDANVYLHRGGEFVRYNLISAKVEEGPKPNNPAWTGGFLAFPWIASDLRGGAIEGTGPFGKITQTLKFGAFQDRLLEDLPFQAFATTSTGVQATVISVTPNVCRVVNVNWVVFGNSIDKGPGLCSLKAFLAGNDWLNDVEEIESFNILPPGSTPPPTWTPTPANQAAATPTSTATPAASITPIAPMTVTPTPTGTGGKQNQSITFDPLPSRILSESPITLSASASSGLPVAFNSLSIEVCAVNGNVATLLKVGQCIIRASQAGNASFNPAPDVGQVFSIVAQGTPQPTHTPTPTATPIPTPNPSRILLPGLWRSVGPV